MSQTAKQSKQKSNPAGPTADSQALVKDFRGVRYQVKDVSRSISFYNQQLGLKLDMQNLPVFPKFQ